MHQKKCMALIILFIFIAGSCPLYISNISLWKEYCTPRCFHRTSREALHMKKPPIEMGNPANAHSWYRRNGHVGEVRRQNGLHDHRRWSSGSYPAWLGEKGYDKQFPDWYLGNLRALTCKYCRRLDGHDVRAHIAKWLLSVGFFLTEQPQIILSLHYILWSNNNYYFYSIEKTLFCQDKHR